MISAGTRIGARPIGNRRGVTHTPAVPDGLLPAVRRIVVLRANGLGDYVVAQPALAALRAAYPDAVITLVTSPPVAALLDGRPSPVDEVLAAPRVAGVRGEPGPDGPPDDPPDVVEEFCAVLRARRFDLGIQLHGGGRNANPLLLRFGARITAGSRAPGAAPLDRTVPWTAFQHDLMRWLEVVSLVGVEPVCLRPRVAVTARDRAEAADALAGVDRGPVVAVHPGATDPRRRWLPRRLGELGAALDALGARIVLLGGSGDAPLVDEIRAGLGAAAGRAVDLSGRLSVGGLVGVLESADLFIGNDSGPRHLAEAVGTATVGVFTRANLVDVSPLFRARHRVLVSWQSRCVVCGEDYVDEPCGHEASVLGDITVDDVLAPALELLDLPVRRLPRTSWRVRALLAPDRALHQVEHGVELIHRQPLSQVRHQSLQDEVEVAGEHRDGDVVAHRACGGLPLEPGPGRGGQCGGVGTPALLELGIRAQPAGHLQPRAQPAALVAVRMRQQLAHHLDEPLRGDDVGHPLGVLLGEREEQRVLVPVVMEDRPAGQTGALLQSAHRRALVAEPREARPGAVEDLLPPGGEMVAADPGHPPTLMRVLWINVAAEWGGDPQVE